MSALEAPTELPAALARRFEPAIFDWDGTAVPDRQAPAGPLRRLVEDLCARHRDRQRHAHLRVGRPGEHVVGVAEETGADLIALGWAQDLSPGRAVGFACLAIGGHQSGWGSIDRLVT